MPDVAIEMETSTLGVIAGLGRLPLQIINRCQAEGRPCFVLAIAEGVHKEVLDAAPHAFIRLGAIGEGLQHLRSVGAKQIVFAGAVERPSFFKLKPDATGAKMMARLGASLFSGDDALLSSIIKLFEEEGFEVIQPHTIIGDMMAPKGILGKHKPDDRAEQDIARGIAIAHALGKHDIGQSLIIENGYVLGVEAAEGTAALIQRCASLQRDGRAILIKAKKPEQELRADLPTIGADTVKAMMEAGMLGIAVEAGHTQLIDEPEMTTIANAAGMFIIGI